MAITGPRMAATTVITDGRRARQIIGVPPVTA